MAREIAEQPRALADTLAALLPMRDAVRRVAAGRRHLRFVARGSSDNACVYARYLSEVHARIPAVLAAPSVSTLYRSPLDLSDTVVVAVSQSGSTQEIVEALEWSASGGAATIAISNVEDSPLAAAADLALITQAGPELAVPATKSYIDPGGRARGRRGRARAADRHAGRRLRGRTRAGGADAFRDPEPTRSPSGWPAPRRC